MKRQFNIYDGLFLLALVFKLRNIEPVPKWWEVFAPYMLEAVTVVIVAIFATLGIKERLKFWLWQLALKLRVKMAGKKARQFMKAQAEKGKEQARNGNPGRFIDPQITGK